MSLAPPPVTTQSCDKAETHGQVHDLRRHRLVNARQDIRGACPFRDSRHGFRFCENRASRGELDRICRFQRQGADVLDLHVKYPGDDLEEFAASTGAFFILYEIGYAAVAVQFYGPAELAAYIHDGSGRRDEMKDCPPHGM